MNIVIYHVAASLSQGLLLGWALRALSGTFGLWLLSRDGTSEFPPLGKQLNLNQEQPAAFWPTRRHYLLPLARCCNGKFEPQTLRKPHRAVYRPSLSHVHVEETPSCDQQSPDPEKNDDNPQPHCEILFLLRNRLLWKSFQKRVLLQAFPRPGLRLQTRRRSKGAVRLGGHSAPTRRAEGPCLSFLAGGAVKARFTWGPRQAHGSRHT